MKGELTTGQLFAIAAVAIGLLIAVIVIFQIISTTQDQLPQWFSKILPG